MFLRRINTIKAIAFSKIWHEHDYHYELLLWTSPRSGLFETMILQQNTITKWSNQKYMMNSYQDRVSNFYYVCIRTVFETIWNCREHFENNVSKVCTVTVFETIWNCRKHLKTIHLKHAIWRYFELQKTF